MKTNQKNKKHLVSLMIVAILSLTMLFLGYCAYSNDIFNIKNSDAKSKSYSKSYPAGDIVEKKPIKVLNYNDADPENNNEDPYDQSIPQINWRSIGHKINVSINSNKHKINGWRTRTSPDIPRMTYISKPFVIPKPENTHNRPMAVQLCWKTKNKNTIVAVNLYREGTRSWYSTGPIIYDQSWESNRTTRKLGCFGYSEYIYYTDEGDFGDPVNKQIKARMYVAVVGGPIDIFAIKVKSIKLPTQENARYRSDFYSGKYFNE